MFWFLVIVVVLLLIFAPALLATLGLVAVGGFLIVAIPLAVFFGIWGGTIWVVSEVSRDQIWIGVVGGFALGIFGARWLVLRVKKMGTIDPNVPNYERAGKRFQNERDYQDWANREGRWKNDSQ